MGGGRVILAQPLYHIPYIYTIHHIPYTYAIYQRPSQESRGGGTTVPESRGGGGSPPHEIRPYLQTWWGGGTRSTASRGGGRPAWTPPRTTVPPTGGALSYTCIYIYIYIYLRASPTAAGPKSEGLVFSVWCRGSRVQCHPA